MWRAWTEGGADRPAALFLHGWLMDHRDEKAAFDGAFSQAGFARLYCDLPGMGNSHAVPVPHDLDGFLDALTALVAGELGHRPFVLCGTSAGAYLARGLAARLGDQVRGMVLRVPLVQPDDAARDRDAIRPLHQDSTVMARQDAALLNLLDQPPLIQTDRWIAALAAKLRSTVLPAMACANHAALDRLRTDPARYVLRDAADWPDFIAPALIVAARQDSSVGWRDALAAFSGWPRASFAVLDAAGHEWPLSHQKPLLDALVEDFLRRVEDAG